MISLPVRQRHVDVLEVVRARAADDDAVRWPRVWVASTCVLFWENRNSPW